MIHQDTICALATASGIGAIAVIRVSGVDAIKLTDKIFRSKIYPNKKLMDFDSHTVHLGYVLDEENIIDEALFSIFKAPNSYTAENVVEISVHGSMYIQQKILELLNKNGIRNAEPGEFTFRAFMNGKMDLSQAEAVADLIASDSKASHELAIKQMRGGFSNQINELRREMINFAALMELELDFSEEDIEFADRDNFYNLLNQLQDIIKKLIDSFSYGNVIKNGVPVAIVGAPNTGKSTLLNMLLGEERAIVSDIAGTTRDTIEEVLYLSGIAFRFIDTAGIRQADNHIEQIGIEKTFEKIDKASVLLYLYDSSQKKDISEDLKLLNKEGKIIFCIANKSDISIETIDFERLRINFPNIIFISISAKTGENIDLLKKELTNQIQLKGSGSEDTIVSNSRHLEALQNTLTQIGKIRNGLDLDIPGDLLAQDIREALKYLGQITGEIDVDEDILGTIFSSFCIGK